MINHLLHRITLAARTSRGLPAGHRHHGPGLRVPGGRGPGHGHRLAAAGLRGDAGGGRGGGVALCGGLCGGRGHSLDLTDFRARPGCCGRRSPSG
ncbi:hypothetical protein ACRAWF_20715 [Streptomyces sp. L7]